MLRAGLVCECCSQSSPHPTGSERQRTHVSLSTDMGQSLLPHQLERQPGTCCHFPECYVTWLKGLLSGELNVTINIYKESCVAVPEGSLLLEKSQIGLKSSGKYIPARCVCVSMFICVYTCMYVYVYMFTCVYTCGVKPVDVLPVLYNPSCFPSFFSSLPTLSGFEIQP